MKVVRTVVVFDHGGLVSSKEWEIAHQNYTGAIARIVHPQGNDRFVMRRRTLKLDARGKPSGQWMRNGVVPIRNQFLERFEQLGWKAEQSVELGKPAEKVENAGITPAAYLKEYPSLRDYNVNDADWRSMFSKNVGDFDFYSELPCGLRCVIEWETGNISSSHRSMNKLCLTMMAGVIEIGVLILPSRSLYTHLTDRIGNWMELSPYLPLWQCVGNGIARGLLAITVVEHDELTDDPRIPYIVQGSDGRSAEGAAKLV